MPSAKSKLLQYFQSHVGEHVHIDVLAEVAGTHDWPRSVRTLRQQGHDIEHLKSGEYKGCYVMRSLEKKEGKIRGGIDQKTRYRILQRDDSRCQRCGRGVAEGARLVIDHKIPVEWGGLTQDDNLWVLCEECNLGKKHWFKDESAEEMKQLMAESSGYRRLEMYFTMHPNEVINVAKLNVVAGIRDWPRTLRSLREKSKMEISYVRPSAESPKEGYIYKKD